MRAGHGELWTEKRCDLFPIRADQVWRNTRPAREVLEVVANRLIEIAKTNVGSAFSQMGRTSRNPFCGQRLSSVTRRSIGRCSERKSQLWSNTVDSGGSRIRGDGDPGGWGQPTPLPPLYAGGGQQRYCWHFLNDGRRIQGSVGGSNDGWGREEVRSGG